MTHWYWADSERNSVPLPVTGDNRFSSAGALLRSGRAGGHSADLWATAYFLTTLKRWGAPRKGLCSQSAHLCATADFVPVILSRIVKRRGPPRPHGSVANVPICRPACFVFEDNSAELWFLLSYFALLWFAAL